VHIWRIKEALGSCVVWVCVRKNQLDGLVRNRVYSIGKVLAAADAAIKENGTLTATDEISLDDIFLDGKDIAGELGSFVGHGRSLGVGGGRYKIVEISCCCNQNSAADTAAGMFRIGIGLGAVGGVLMGIYLLVKKHRQATGKVQL
jgi:hypothetical protein